MNNIGKPCTGKSYARFDEGGQVDVSKVRLLRHQQTKGVVTDRSDLRDRMPVLYSTQNSQHCAEMVTPKRHHQCAIIESENNSIIIGSDHHEM